jgi:hypothetical protein
MMAVWVTVKFDFSLVFPLQFTQIDFARALIKILALIDS